MTTATPALDPRTTALLVMDFQQGLLASLPGAARPGSAAVAGAQRHRGPAASHGAGHRLRGGSASTEADWAAIPPGNKTFSYLGQQRLMHYGGPPPRTFTTSSPPSPTTSQCARRASARCPPLISNRQAAGPRKSPPLVIAGLTTSGVVPVDPSPNAADRDYQLYILSDAVADPRSASPRGF